MDATTGVSLAKSALEGLLGLAGSLIAEQVALQLGVQTDLTFIRDEFQMMQAFLQAADGQRAGKGDVVLATWLRQLRDLANDVEDCLQDFAVHLQKPSCWHFPRTVKARLRIANEIKDLKARVEDVSTRNLRYKLITGTSPPSASLSGSRGKAAFGADGDYQSHDVELIQLISGCDKALGVISVCGESDAGRLSVIREAYDDPKTRESFGCRAWVKVKHPFNPDEFLKSLVREFNANSIQVSGEVQEEEEEATIVPGIKIMNEIERMADGGLINEAFAKKVNKSRYLIVLDDLYDVEEWNWIKMYLPDKKYGSRVLVSTKLQAIATLCPEPPIQKSELRNLPYDQAPLFLLFKEDLQYSGTDPTPTMQGIQKNSEATGDNLTRSITEIEEDQPNLEVGKNPASITSVGLDEASLIGRGRDKSDIMLLISKGNQHRHVIAVFGMGGVGKTALVRSIYQSQHLTSQFEKRAWVNVSHPFNCDEFSRSLHQQLHEDSKRLNRRNDLNKDVMWRRLAKMGSKNFNEKMGPRRLDGEKGPDKLNQQTGHKKRCLVVLDDMLSYTEWGLIEPRLFRACSGSIQVMVIVTTREENVAKRFDEKHKLEPLDDDSALELFKRKVLKDPENSKLDDSMWTEGELILKKCGGLPLAIVTIGGLLATRPQEAREWRNLRNHIRAELNYSQELAAIKDVLSSCYENLPYHLKCCFLYLSIFSEDRNIRKRRIVRRWIAEGYSREMGEMTAEEVAEKYFTGLVNGSMIQRSKISTSNGGNFDSFCQVQNLMHEISRSKSQEENLVLVLDEDKCCSWQFKNKVRHLVVSGGWSREKKKNDLESIVDLSHIRSLTVCGEWQSFLLSNKMKLLRVLDLEETYGLQDHDLLAIRKLHHLRYLSLRGCEGIFHLPTSIGNLSNLETLDIRDTNVVKLPSTIVKLQKLKYIRAGRIRYNEDHSSKKALAFLKDMYKIFVGEQPVGDEDKKGLKEMVPLVGLAFTIWYRNLDQHGVEVPRGVGKLKALHTLGIVNVARGKAILKELDKLAQLHKLGVTGISKGNCKGLFSAIRNHSHLQSLSLRAEGEPGLQGCLDDMCPPPEDLQTLKLYGNLVELPKGMHQLHNLQDLTLVSTQLEHKSVQVLGALPNLFSLRFWEKSLKEEELHLHFHHQTFESLTVLELRGLDGLKSVKFEEHAMSRLGLLKVLHCSDIEEAVFSGLSYLSSLKLVSIEGLGYRSLEEYLQELKGADNSWNEEYLESLQELLAKKRKFREDLLVQLHRLPKKDILKMED